MRADTYVQRVLWAAVGGAVLLCGCGPRPTGPVAERPRRPTSREFPASSWSCTWTGDAKRVEVRVADNAAEVLIEGAAAGGSKGSILSASIDDWGLTPQASFRVRLSVAERPLPVALAVRTDQYYESPSQVLPPGEHELVFPLATNTFKSARSNWAHSGRVDDESPLQQIELVLYPDAGALHTLAVRSAVLEGVRGPSAPPAREFRPLEIVDARALSGEAEQYGCFEISALVTTAYTNGFDPAEIVVNAVFMSPAGATRICPAFLYAYGAGPGEPDEWRARFSPDLAGPWTWTLIAITPSATVTVPPDAPLTCRPSARRGPVSVSKSDPACFEDALGGFYYPIGHNVCWNSLRQYEEQFGRMREAGENWSRIWIAPWNCEIEWSAQSGKPYRGLLDYNLDRAARLDRIVELAETNGIYLQLVLHEHCRLSARTNPEWHNNPYNQALGGPCAKPGDFRTHPEARRLAKNRLRYIVSRWGYSSQILAWELFNEADLADDFEFDTDAAWHREMADFLRKTDPHGHLVTTSYISTPNPLTYALPEIDYAQSHIYSPDVVSQFARIQPLFTRFGKPHFIGEFGRHTADGVDKLDTEGRVLHSGIWAQFLLPSGGNAMSWWWYDLIDPNLLYRLFRPLAEFARGIDRRGGRWTAQTGTLQAGASNVRVLALASADTVLAWLYDPRVLPWSDTPLASAERLSGTLVLENAGAEPWQVETWNTWSHTPPATSTVRPENGTLSIPLDAPGPDAAIKLRRAAPGAVPAFRLGAWNPAAPAPRAELTIPRVAPGSIAVDGDAADWAARPGRAVGPGPRGHSFTFKVCHDGANLFVAAEVKDSDVVRRNDAGGTLWKDDCVEVWLDSRFDADPFRNLSKNPACYQFNIAPAAEGRQTDQVVYRNNEWNDRPHPAVESASRLTPDGYVVEARFPLADLRGPGTPDDPSRIGFNVSTCNASRDGGWDHLLWQGANEWDAMEWSVGVME